MEGEGTDQVGCLPAATSSELPEEGTRASIQSRRSGLEKSTLEHQGPQSRKARTDLERIIQGYLSWGNKSLSPGDARRKSVDKAVEHSEFKEILLLIFVPKNLLTLYLSYLIWKLSCLYSCAKNGIPLNLCLVGEPQWGHTLLRQPCRNKAKAWELKGDIEPTTLYPEG